MPNREFLLVSFRQIRFGVLLYSVGGRVPNGVHHLKWLELKIPDRKFLLKSFPLPIVVVDGPRMRARLGILRQLGVIVHLSPVLSMRYQAPPVHPPDQQQD